MPLKLVVDKVKGAYFSKSGIGNKIHLVILNVTSCSGYGNFSVGDGQLIKSEDHKFKDDCNMASGEQNVVSASVHKLDEVFPSRLRGIFV